MKRLKLVIHPEAQAIGITNAVACVISGVAVISGSFLEPEITAVLQTAVGCIDMVHPMSSYRGYQRLFTNLGYTNQQTACDKLIRQYTRKGFKQINNIIDSYNICSVQNGSPLGLHDASKLSEEIVIRRAKNGDTITPLFKQEAIAVNPGDLVYTSQDRPLCWMGTEDLDSDHFKVSDTTTEVFLMVIGNELTDQAFNKNICEQVLLLLQKSCSGARMVVLDTVLL